MADVCESKGLGKGASEEDDWLISGCHYHAHLRMTLTLNLLYAFIQRMIQASSNNDYNSCHIQYQPESEGVLTLPHRTPPYPGIKSASANATDVGCLGVAMEHAEHANKLTFHTVFSTDPGWRFGPHFATVVGESSGQMFVEVATRDIRGCDSWRKCRTKHQVSGGAAKHQDSQDQGQQRDGRPQAAMGTAARRDGQSTIKASEAEV